MTYIAGVSLAELPSEDLGDELLAELWRQVGLLHAHRIAHLDLGRWSVVVDERQQPWLVDFDASEAMAGDRMLAADVAELLVSLAHMVGAERALAGADAALGQDVARSAMEQTAPSALTPLTRDDLHAHPNLWEDLRRRAMGTGPSRTGSTPADQDPASSAPTGNER
jgi:glycosyltransferase 2 family protein